MHRNVSHHFYFKGNVLITHSNSPGNYLRGLKTLLITSEILTCNIFPKKRPEHQAYHNLRAQNQKDDCSSLGQMSV